MAKARNLLGITGKVGELCIYVMNGKYVVRKKPGSNRQRMMKDPSYQLCRENSSEFSGCSKAGKAIRDSLGEVRRLGTGYVSARLNALLKKICVQEAGARGERPILLTGSSKAILEGFELNTKYPFAYTVPGPITCTVNQQRNSATITIACPDPQKIRQLCPGATHYRLTCSIAGVSDHVYDASIKAYRPLHQHTQDMKAVSWSGYLDAQSVNASTVSITASLQAAAGLPTACALFVFSGIEFYQLNGIVHTPLKEGQGLKLLKVL